MATEEENAEKCPCKKQYKVPMLKCKTCPAWWHTKCVGLSGLSVKELEKLKEWHCPLCYRLPEGVKQQSTLETIDKKLSELRSDLVDKIEKKANDQTKKWSDLFSQDRDSEQVQHVVTQAVEKSKQRMDYDHMEREKRKKNIVLREIEESTEESADDKKAEDKSRVIEILGLSDDDIEHVFRAGKPNDGDSPRPRPLIITVKTPEIAVALHGHGRGRKFRHADAGEDVWCNPDLIDSDRKANYLARQERKKRRRENGRDAAHAGVQTRSGSFLQQSQTRG